MELVTTVAEMECDGDGCLEIIVVGQTLPRCVACDYDLCNECAEETLHMQQAVVNMNAKDGAGGDKDRVDSVDGSGVGVEASSGGSGIRRRGRRRRRRRSRTVERGKDRVTNFSNWGSVLAVTL